MAFNLANVDAGFVQKRHSRIEGDRAADFVQKIDVLEVTLLVDRDS